MTEADYKARNLQGFEGDIHMRDEFKRLIKKHKIGVVVETGTYLGGTTKKLAEMVAKVITVEIDTTNFIAASKYLEGTENVKTYIGSSPTVLAKLIPFIKTEKSFFFLDAHWGNVCPLKDELREIAAAGIRPVIAIHDFKVPGADFGYDSYNGQDFTYEWLKADLDAVYGEKGYTYYYNTKAEGARRGVLYCEPTK